MSESSGGAELPALRERLLGRLREGRWVTAAALAVVLLLGWWSDASALAIAAGCLAILAAAMFGPRMTIAQRREAVAAARTGLDGVTASKALAAVPDPVIVTDEDGSLVHANAAARSAFAPLAQGTSVRLRFRSPEMRQLLDTVLSGEAASASAEYAERVPLERWFRVTARPLGEGSQLFVLVFKDQSELRRIDRMRADFIANASHELRTPLASIAGFIETIRGPARNDPKAQDHFLQIMQSQTARMARLIDDLLSLSRLEMKAQVGPGSLVDIVPVIEGVVDSLGHLAAESGVEIARRLPPGPIMVNGSRDELIQVFENLLENACKYGQSGGRVEIEAVTSDQETVVSVIDFGPGIPAEHIPRITERFYRIDVETSRAQKGTGLGLAIVKHILTRHNARLSVRSEVGKGATFSVVFPRA